MSTQGGSGTKATIKNPERSQLISRQLKPPAQSHDVPLLSLQRSAGNRASTALLGYALGSSDRELIAPPQVEADEREADALADRIDAVIANPPAPPADRADAGTDSGGAKPPAPPDQTSGLPRPLREWLERFTGHDLSEVRIRADQRAAASAERLGAKAFTEGRDIFFAAGTYAPASREGARLVSHEVAHTIQQTQSGTRGPQLKPKKKVAADTVAKVQRITFYRDSGLVVFELSDGTSAATDATYNGHPNPGNYPIRREGDRFPAPNGAGGQANEQKRIIQWTNPKRVTFDGVTSYTLRVLGGRPGEGGVTGNVVSGGGVAGGVGRAGGSQAGMKDSVGSGKEEAGKGSGARAGTGEGGKDKQGAPAALTPQEEERWRELYEKMTGGLPAADQDPRELLRLYRVLVDKVQDPVFSRTEGQPWDRFAKFLDQNRDKIEGILNSGEKGKLTQEKLEQIIQEYGKFVAGEPWIRDEQKQLQTAEDYDKEFAYDPGWQKLSKADKKLLLEYSRLSPEEAAKTKIDFTRVTVDMKVAMALKLSWKSWPAEVAEAAKASFSDPSFIITLVVVMAIYVGLWLTPDPAGPTKVLAGALTVFMLAQFALSDIVGFALAWSDLIDACAAAKTVPELQGAGDVFARKVGQVGFDIILMLVLWRVGKRVSPKLRKIGAERAVTRAEAAVDVAKAVPGSGVPKAAGGAPNLLEMAKAKAQGSTTGTKPPASGVGTTTTTKPPASEAGSTTGTRPPETEPATSTKPPATESGSTTATEPPTAETDSTSRTTGPKPGEATPAGEPAPPAPETAVLDALSDLLPKEAKSALAEFRAKKGDAGALKKLDKASAAGQDISRFLTEELVPKEVRAKPTADLIKAEAKLARAKIIQAEVIKDPALRKAVIEEHGSRLRWLLSDLGILESPDVQKLIKAKALNELTGVLGEALQRLLLRSEFPSNAGNRILPNTVVGRRVPGYRTIAEWAKARRAEGVESKIVSRQAAKLLQKDGVVYESLGEVDGMVVEEVAGGKLRPKLLEEVKTGGSEGLGSQARAQVAKGRAALTEARTNPAEVRVFELLGKKELGADLTDTLDLSTVEGTATRTRGPSPEEFDTELGYEPKVLEQVAADLISKGLPPKEPQPAVAPTPKRKEKAKR